MPGARLLEAVDLAAEGFDAAGGSRTTLHCSPDPWRRLKPTSTKQNSARRDTRCDETKDQATRLVIQSAKPSHQALDQKIGNDRTTPVIATLLHKVAG